MEGCLNFIVVILTNVGVSASSSYQLQYNEEDFPVVMSNVTCVGDESRLTDCPFTLGGNGSPVSLTCSLESKSATSQCYLTLAELLRIPTDSHHPPVHYRCHLSCVCEQLFIEKNIHIQQLHALVALGLLNCLPLPCF